MSDPLQHFDIDDPELPKWIKKGALSSGGYPYEDKMKGEDYFRQLHSLQVELVKLQQHQIATNGRIVILFEGRDAAGKGGSIEAFRENTNGRYWLDIALPKPSDREATQWYFQRYLDWLPAGGETALFDRSWYNRGVVEPVMGFCTPEQTDKFLDEAPRFEAMLVRDGIHLFKFWLAIGQEMQLKRFHDRRHDPLKTWKISPIDISAIGKWDDYTSASHRMLKETSTHDAPWRVILSNDKRRARLAIMRIVLGSLDYKDKDESAVGEPDKKLVLDPETFVSKHSDE